jgi:hypothetical protein
MQRVGDLAIALFNAIIIFSLIYFVLIKIEPIFWVFIVLYHAHVDTLGQADFVSVIKKSYLFPLIILGLPFAERKFFVFPIVKNKLFFIYTKKIFIIVDV